MSDIKIRRAHALGHQQARDAAERIAADLQEKFDLAYRWEGDSLYFDRSGISGCMDVEESEVRVDVKLGFLLLPFKSRFEQAIHQYMDELFQEA